MCILEVQHPIVFSNKVICLLPLWRFPWIQKPNCKSKIFFFSWSDFWSFRYCIHSWNETCNRELCNYHGCRFISSCEKYCVFSLYHIYLYLFAKYHIVCRRSTMIGITLLSCITQDKLKWYYSLRIFSNWFFNKSCITVRKLLTAKYVILPYDLYGPKQALTWKKKLLEGAYSRCKWVGNTLSGLTRWELEGERKREKEG